jgi:hypothetical protein
MTAARSISLGRDSDGVDQVLTPEARSTHLHVVGASGKGKSRALENMIRQDIQHGHGVCVIDPHGALVSGISKWCARLDLQHRRKIHLIDPNNLDWTTGFDPLRCTDPDYLSKTIDTAVNACAQVWGGEDTNKTPLLKKCLRAVFYALAAGGRTMGEAIALTAANDPDGFRRTITGALPDEVFQAVWDDFNSMSPRDRADAFASTNNRLIEFLASPTIRRMLSLKDEALDVRKCMEEGHVILVNLQPKLISQSNARVIGTLLTSALFSHAVQRDESAARRRPFYLYIDECYSFLTEEVEAMLDQTRKFGLHVVLAHQRLGQLGNFYNAVMTNAQTKMVFGGLSDEDAEKLVKEVLRETFDYDQPKEILNKPTVVGYQTVSLRSSSESRTSSWSRGRSSGSSTSTGRSQAHGYSQTFGADGLPVTGQVTHSWTEGESESGGRSQTESSSFAESTSQSEGVSEAFLPILKMMPSAVVGHEEIMHRAILGLRRLPKREFVLSRPGFSPVLVQTPMVAEPHVATTRIEGFATAVREASPYTVEASKADALVVLRRGRGSRWEPEDGDTFSVPEP